MKTADLEIRLDPRDVGGYQLELSLDRPDSLTIPDLLGSERVQFDMDGLRSLQLDPTAYGRLLGESVFGPEKIRAAFDKAWAVAQSHKWALRIRLFIDPGAGELQNLRWETLYLEDHHLLTDEHLLFSRYLSSPDNLNWRPVKRGSKSDLRSLVVIANPTDIAEYGMPVVDVDAELQRVKAGLGERVTALASGGKATLQHLMTHLREGYEILYLSAHGRLFDDEPWLWLETDSGETDRVAGSELAIRLRELIHRPQLIVLVSCQSAGTGEATSPGKVGGLTALGPLLAKEGIPTVLAMQGNISIKTANEFIPVFFKELQKDGQIDRAMVVARGAMRERPDWWMPVLFMRLKDGRLWDVEGNLEEKNPSNSQASSTGTMREPSVTSLGTLRKILILATNPKDKSRLRLDEQVREIDEGLRRSKHREQFIIQSKGAVRFRDLRRAMLDEEPQIIHFCGHGDRDGLVVEDGKGEAVLANPEALADLFRFFNDQVECVLLNASYSETQAKVINTHIKYVIGMSRGIGDNAALEFAVGFYDALGAGRSYEEAFKFGCNAIQLENIPEDVHAVFFDKGKKYKKELDKNIYKKQTKDENKRCEIIGFLPGDVPLIFQDRERISSIIGTLSKNRNRLMIIHGRHGMGKTSCVCRVFESLGKKGHLPDNPKETDLGNHIKAIIWFSTIWGTITFEKFYEYLKNCLSREAQRKLEQHCEPKAKTARIRSVVEELIFESDSDQIIWLLVDYSKSSSVKSKILDVSESSDFFEALKTILGMPQHPIKVIVITDDFPKSLPKELHRSCLREPSEPLEPLKLEDAEKLLIKLDEKHGDKLLLRTTNQEKIKCIYRITQGIPKALRQLYTILHEECDDEEGIDKILSGCDKYTQKEIVEQLSHDAFDSLDESCVQVMKALAMYGSVGVGPVSPEAIEHILDGSDTERILHSLSKRQYVKKDDKRGQYFLHWVEQKYAFTRLKEDEEKAKDWFLRGAEYFEEKYDEPHVTFEDLVDIQVNEFRLRCAAQDYGDAMRLLKSFRKELEEKGQYKKIINLCDPLYSDLKNENNGDLEKISLLSWYLGMAYGKIGRYTKALEYYKALDENHFPVFHNRIRLIHDRACCYWNIGKIQEAHKDLTRCRKLYKSHRGDYEGQGGIFYTLGRYYADLGEKKFKCARLYYEAALNCFKQAKNPGKQSRVLVAKGFLLLAEMKGQKECLVQARQLCENALENADDIETKHKAHLGQAFAYFFLGELPEASEAALKALEFTPGLGQGNTYNLMGLIALQKHKTLSGQEDLFKKALDCINEPDALEDYDIWYAKGLAHCGLTLTVSENREKHVEDAIKAYIRAQEINRQPGVLSRALRLFNILRKMDEDHYLNTVYERTFNASSP